MKNEFKKIDLNTLYKVLKKHDDYILNHFCDTSLSDEDYFSYGIKSDILSNALNILVDYFTNNIESPGVDASCRAIIEALVILKMDSMGKISNEQKRIYRYLYTFVDFDNFRSITNREALRDKRLKQFADDKKKAQEAILEHFNCSIDDLKNNVGIDDPCFYLKTKLNEDIRFSKLLSEYSICDGDAKLYEFFSLFIHPRCEIDSQIEELISQMRLVSINKIINMVFDYLHENNMWFVDESIQSFNDLFYGNLQLVNNIHNIQELQNALDYLIGAFCVLKDGVDGITLQFLKNVKCMLTDMLTSLSLGYKERVIATYKSFIEEYSVFFSINCVDDLNEFNYIKKGFLCSSRIQIDAQIEDVVKGFKLAREEDIKDIYENFYKKKYGLNNYKKFYWELRRNSLYFIDDAKKSYNKYVQKLINEVFDNESERQDVKILYKISKDMSHASGYNFNASEGIIDLSCQKVLYYSMRFVLHYVLNASITLHEHGINRNVKPIIDFFKALMEIHADAIDECIKLWNNN